MVKASKFVANETLLSFVMEAGGSIALMGASEDGTDAFANLRDGDRGCPFFFPSEPR